MTTHRIYHVDGKTVLFECEAASQRDAMLTATSKRANLSGAYQIGRAHV